MDDEYQTATQARDVDQRWLKHMQLSREMTRGMVNVGMAMDKANVRGLSLSNGVITLPGNEYMELLPPAFLFLLVVVYV